MSSKIPMNIKVKHLMEMFPELRGENDALLLKRVYKRILRPKGIELEDLSLLEFFQLIATKEPGKRTYMIPLPGSIVRSRQIIEHNISNLRGKTYNYRHKIEEPKVRQLVIDLNASLERDYVKYK